MQLIVIMSTIVGGLIGGLTEAANWDLALFPTAAGLIGGLCCGAALARSLMLPYRLQLPIFAALAAMGWGFYAWFTPHGVQWLAPLMAGGIALVLSVLASKIDDSPA